ncbi:GNAT family N-acetyltransferase [Nisaea acidiphila]|uniref:GNAT family N-acetyltransferase n=1 Tax=Nisaea acidiphila TaxID=1862145 RepID=A0A9J7AQU7_9PROT|nr:GNAT family N-acetyltransferase [Nisaea acidiphila]UUX49760.1 GNAT family N-acetyltransferase [Nisaea acidiphila]
MRLYLDTALDAVAAGARNRMAHFSPAGGVILSIAFDGLEVHSSLGPLADDDLRLLAEGPSRRELQLLPEHADRFRLLCADEPLRERTALFYALSGRPTFAMPPAVRRLGPEDAPAIAAFMTAHYDDTVFSGWMLAAPFFAAFENGEIAATAGTVLLHAPSGRANLGNLLTRPDLRGKGHARRAFEGLLSHLGDTGYTALSLITTEENLAVRSLAESCGFRILEKRVQIDLGS